MRTWRVILAIVVAVTAASFGLVLGTAQADAHGIHKSPIADGYNSKIIDDVVFISHTAMSEAAIQSFLESKVPSCQTGYTCLKDYVDPTVGKRASRIIWEETQTFGMNPQVILSTLQKEQSLVTDDFPYESQYRTAMGYGCPESQSICDSEYYGFYNQIRLGTKLLRVGHDRNCGNMSSYPGWSVNTKWRLGNTTAVDGKATFMGSCATGSLMNYTPHRPDSGWLPAADTGGHFYGNYNFIYFFNNWFGSTYGDVCLESSNIDATKLSGLIQVFAANASDELGCKLYNKVWTDLRSLGGGITAAPGAVSIAPGIMDVFVRGGDNGLWHRRYHNGWTQWSSLGGNLKSAPVAVSPSAGIIDVFARGADDSLVHRRYHNGWQPWESLGGLITDAPGIVSPAPGVMDVFVKGGTGAMWHRRYDRAWHEWENLGQNLNSAPAASSPSIGIIDVFWRSADNTLAHSRYHNAWQPTESFPAILTSAPSTISISPGTLEVFVRGEDNGLWQKRYVGGWSDWISLGGALNSAPSAALFK